MKFTSDGLILSSLVEDFWLGECNVICILEIRGSFGIRTSICNFYFILFYLQWRIFWNLNDIFSY